MASSTECACQIVNSLALLRRLQEFSKRWVDGDGHSIYTASAVLASCRDMLPEIHDALLTQEHIYSNEMPGIFLKSDKERACISALAVHEIVHAFVQNELADGGHFEASGVTLAMSTKLGKGFRARNIESLLRDCFKQLEDAYDSQLYAECASYSSVVTVVNCDSTYHAEGRPENI